MKTQRHLRKAGRAGVAVTAVLAAAVALALGPGPASASPAGAPPPAPDVVTGAGDWLTARGSDLRLGQARGAGALTRATVASLRTVWTAPVVTPPFSEVVVQGGAVYTNTLEGTLVRLRTSDGSVVWRQDAGTIGVTPALDHGVVYTSGSTVRAFRASDGTLLWSVKPPTTMNGGGGIGVRGDTLAVGRGGLLVLLDKADGATQRVTNVLGDDPDSYGYGTPAIDPRGVAWYAYKWLGSLPVPPTVERPFRAPRHSGNGSTTPMVLGDRVLVAATSVGLTSYDLATGTKTVLDPTADGRHRDLATDGTLVFDVTSSRADGQALTARRATDGSVVWRRPGAVTSPLVLGDLVVVGEDRAGIAMYDTATGALVHRIPGTARGAYPVVANGRLYLGYASGTVPTDTVPPVTAFALPG
ncbi:PQQ-binding-like beta-propeller repeat protein [Lapillicoccus jejuensis]|uniref:Putative pyrroloquinoline-quinone binding quinoprotein n=1 Tax=Lapillicoccus jejuensis TaxID=402171 RepID=A0A542E025_9MICO|nr:PQQ-binding-like beta-propeller repeat protein [Lapillicoccus jejuensis]TQJ08678.1 putative pyrroloquinoline-quinone binding quinoprotein [Lapillicoccus jejuensis]